MAKNEEFDLDFDFEKEYGFSPETIMDPEYDDEDEDFDLDLVSEETYTEPQPPQAPVVNQAPAPAPQEPNRELEDDFEILRASFTTPEEAPQEPVQQNSLSEEASFDEFDGDTPAPPVAPVPPQEQPPVMPNPRRRQRPERPERRAEFAPNQDAPAPNPRRKKRSQMRVIKEDYLPFAIAGLALLLCVIFVVGSVIRSVQRNNDRKENEIKASEQAASEAIRLEEEAKELQVQAAAMAAGYDYEGAIALLDSFSGNLSEFPTLVSDRSQYVQMQGQLVEINNFTTVPNLSFHVLIANPAVAFNSKPYGPAYKQNFVTTEEFAKILEQLYANGFVLVNYDSFIVETVDDSGKVTYSTKSIYLPEGKKPVMITETLVNYFEYMIDGDDDGQPDKDGDGFASRLVVDENGKVVCEMVDTEGNTVTGAYDLVPILENFIAAHPDFSYRGARATLAVTGHEGLFGYRTNTDVIKDHGQEYYDEQVAGAKKVAEALRDAGYLIACNSYENVSYARYTALNIQEDLEKWKKEVTPILGDVDIIVFAQGSDISDYSGSKFNVIHNAGFRYFMTTSTNTLPIMEVKKDYVRQYRIMVTGSLMVNSPSSLNDYFDPALVLSTLR